MRAKEFGSWDSRDNSKGGFPDFGNGFNSDLKGKPYQEYKEYADTGMAEYYKYREYSGLASEEEEKKTEDNSDKSKNDIKSKSSKVRNTSKTVRNLVGRFAAIAVGAVVLVNTNPVLAERFPSLQVSAIFNIDESGEHNTPGGSGTTDPDDPGGQTTPGGEDQPGALDPVLTESWKWSEDKMSATLEFSDKDGKIVAQIPATVNTEKTDAACNAEGSITYSATAEYDGKTYSDEKQEVLEPQGHEFGEGTATVLEDGTVVFVFRCSRCGEEFTVSTSFEEE